MNNLFIPGHIPQLFSFAGNRKAFTIYQYIIAFLLACLVVSPALAITDKQGSIWRDQAKRGDRTAFNRLHEEARHGDRIAQFYYGVLFQFGYGMSKNENKAAYWYGKSAEQGYSAALHNLGWMYSNGRGVPLNRGKGRDLYRKAAQQGFRPAQYNLAESYLHGNGLPKDMEKARYWHTKAAEQGHKKSQHSLGWMYHKGIGVPVNIDAAIYWYNLAAEQGYTRAQINLGNIYREKQDYGRAIELYRRAAGQNLAEAQYALGYMYEKGLGVTRSDRTAARWYQQAATQNHDEAKQALARLQSAQPAAKKADNKAMSDREFLDILAGRSKEGIQHTPKSRAITGKWRLTAVSPESDKIAYYIVNLHLKEDGRYLQDSAYDRPTANPPHLNRSEGGWGIVDDEFLALCSNNKKSGSCTHCEGLMGMGIGPICLKLLELEKSRIKLEDDSGITYTYRRTP